MGVARKWYFTSIEMKRAPLYASEIVLLRMSLVSKRSHVGEPTSSSYGRRSPPTVVLIRFDSSFKGLQSHVKIACVTDLSGGT